MGFPTGDGDVEYGDDCLLGWPADLTPKTIGVRFSGIMQGDNWLPVHGAPPNLELTLTQNIAAPCTFDFTAGNLFAQVIFMAAHTNAAIANNPWGIGFDNTVAGNKESYIPNQNIVPAGNFFYGGHGQIAILPGKAPPTIHGVQDLLNMEHSSQTFASSLPLTRNKMIYRFGRRYDSTNALVKTDMPPFGTILSWSGSITDIPWTFHLCDGTHDTPDLRDKFIVGAGLTYAVDAAGGAVNHNHAFTGDGHDHTIPAGTSLAAGTDFDDDTGSAAAAGTTNSSDGRPPWYALAYIMKISEVRPIPNFP